LVTAPRCSRPSGPTSTRISTRPARWRRSTSRPRPVPTSPKRRCCSACSWSPARRSGDAGGVPAGTFRPVGDDREYGQLYPVAKGVIRPLMHALWRINVTGAHNVPAEGPAVFCPNHISFFDSLVLPVVLPRRISYVGKAEYMDSWKTRHIFPAIGMIPIDREGGSASQRALDTATRVLERGELFGTYPEGTRSRDGRPHRGHTGPARLALRTGAPLIPVGLRGTDRIQPAGASLPQPFRSCQ